MVELLPNFIYVFILAKSSFGLLIHFSLFCTRVMALYLRLSFVSVQYLEHKWTEFHQSFTYAFIWTKSTLGLVHIIFRRFVPELWPLIYAKISFPFNILRTNGQNFNKFYICIHVNKIYVGIATHHFSHICTRVMVLDLCQIPFQFNILRTNGQNFTKFYIYAIILTKSSSALLQNIFCLFVQ